MVRKLIGAAALLGMVATPVAAQSVQSNPAAKLSVARAIPANARVSSQTGKNKALGGGILPIVAIVAVLVITGVVVSQSDSA